MYFRKVLYSVSIQTTYLNPPNKVPQISLYKTPQTQRIYEKGNQGRQTLPKYSFPWTTGSNNLSFVTLGDSLSLDGPCFLLSTWTMNQLWSYPIKTYGSISITANEIQLHWLPGCPLGQSLSQLVEVNGPRSPVQILDRQAEFCGQTNPWALIQHFTNWCSTL